MKKIMVIDDDVAVLKTLESYLKSTGKYRIFTSTDGMAALEIIYSEEPDLIIIDVILPKIDGFSLATRIRNSTAFEKMPHIILISGILRDNAYVNEALQRGADLYLKKPIMPQELLSAVSLLLMEGGSI